MVFKKLATTYFANIEDYRNFRKLKFIFYASLFFFLTFLGFGLSSTLISHKYLLATIDFLAAACLLANVFLIYYGKRINFSAGLLIFALCVPQLALVADGGFFHYGIIWCLCLPTIAYFLIGKKIGILVLSIVLVSIAGIVLLGYLGLLPHTYSFGQFSYIAIVYILICLLTFFHMETMEKSENMIKDQQNNHSITGLPNHNKLKLDLNLTRVMMFVLINIDNFKLVNDFYGHKIGDSILMEIARRMRNLGIQNRKIYKLHSDEFAILICANCGDNTTEQLLAEEEVKAIITAIELELKKPYNIDTYDILLDFTLGITLNPRKPMAEAAMALYHAKQRKYDYLIYDLSMDITRQYERNILRIKNLKYAINYENIVLHYQPIMDNCSNRITSYESLMRLTDKEGNLLMPHDFLDIAKKSKLYPLLTKLVVKKAFDFFRDKQFAFSINLSMDDIFNAEVVAYIVGCLREYRIGSRVTFELTESEKLVLCHEIVDFIEAVKKEGARIAIDDFGAGYANFINILNLHVDVLKIDGSLIKDIDINSSSRVIAETIVDFSRRLKIDTVAEFVYSEPVFQAVREIGISYSQGYYIGKPGPAIKTGES